MKKLNTSLKKIFYKFKIKYFKDMKKKKKFKIMQLIVLINLNEYKIILIKNYKKSLFLIKTHLYLK